MNPTRPADDRAASNTVGHVSVHIDPNRPGDVPFLFEIQRRRLSGALVMSAIAHAAAVVALLFVIRYSPAAVTNLDLDRIPTIRDIIWLNQPGPGGGGGGGGNRRPEPPRKVELPGRDKITVPVTKPPEVPKPVEQPKDEPKPEEQLTIPAKPTAADALVLPGALDSTVTGNTGSQGPGSGGGSGTGTGTGIGPGQGPGVGPGWGGGYGGGAYRPGSGIESPILIREVKPQYTPEAMRAKIQGEVWLECVVVPEGYCTDFRVIRSLDPVFGLDEEALKAAKQWRFIPGKRLGQPVPVVVTIQLNFALR